MPVGVNGEISPPFPFFSAIQVLTKRVPFGTFTHFCSLLHCQLYTVTSCIVHGISEFSSCMAFVITPFRVIFTGTTTDCCAFKSILSSDNNSNSKDFRFCGNTRSTSFAVINPLFVNFISNT